MTDDEELLVDAAEAAGYDYRPDGYDEHLTGPCIVVDGFPREWNPLEDDGDCFQLECALRLSVRWGVDFVAAGGPVDGIGFWASEHYDDHPDKGAARRKASVSAAARRSRAKEAWENFAKEHNL